MAIACLRLFTAPPLPPLPLFSVPFLRRRMAFFTSFWALREYFAIATSSGLDPLGNAARVTLFEIEAGAMAGRNPEATFGVRFAATWRQA